MNQKLSASERRQGRAVKGNLALGGVVLTAVALHQFGDANDDVLRVQWVICK